MWKLFKVSVPSDMQFVNSFCPKSIIIFIKTTILKIIKVDFIKKEYPKFIFRKSTLKSIRNQCFLVTWMKGASIIQSSTEQHTLLRMRKRQKKEYKMMNGFLGPFVEDRTHTWRFLFGTFINYVDRILIIIDHLLAHPSLTSLPYKLI